MLVENTELYFPSIYNCADTLEELSHLVSGGNLTSCLYQTMCYLDQYSEAGQSREASTLHQLLDM